MPHYHKVAAREWASDRAHAINRHKLWGES